MVTIGKMAMNKQHQYIKWRQILTTGQNIDFGTVKPVSSNLLILWFLKKGGLSRQGELEQLERLRSEDTPRRPMITHTIDQFILDAK